MRSGPSLGAVMRHESETLFSVVKHLVVARWRAWLLDATGDVEAHSRLVEGLHDAPGEPLVAREGEAPAEAFRLPAVEGVAVVVEKAVGTKCARSWKISPEVGEDKDYPDVTPRDAQALREWRALGVTA